MIGLIGKKKGMSSLFDQGRLMPVTVLEVGPCPIVRVMTHESDGYNAIQIGFGQVAEKRLNKPDAGQFKKSGATPTKVLREIRDFPAGAKAGDVLTVETFKVGDKVDVLGISKGKGYAGVIKRHHFHRPNQTHGTHEAFRGPGSIGQHSYPARTWPGMKMAGRLGGDRVTIKNLVVVSVDAEHGLLLVRGAVPGAAGNLVTVRKAGKRN